jgi:hypothetical protein
MEGDEEVEKGVNSNETSGESSSTSNKNDVVVKIGLVGDAQVGSFINTHTR